MHSFRLSVMTVVVACLTVAAGVAGAQTDAQVLSPLQMAVACAPPPSAEGTPGNPLHIVGAQDTVPRTLFGNRDLLVIDGGTANGVLLGQQFFVRRGNRFGAGDPAHTHGARTLGWIRVVAVNESTAIATVDHICGGMLRMDYLEPFAPPVVPPGADRDEAPGEPDFTALGRVLAGNEDRTTAGAGDFMLIDRGSDQGVTPGSRFAVYRDIGRAGMYLGLGDAGMPLASVGEAIVITTSATIALTRITRARDTVRSGDYVAIRKQ
jgi:hypothetical protein